MARVYPDSFTTVPEKTKTDTVAKHGSNASDGTVVCDHESHARTGQTDMAHVRAHAHGLCPVPTTVGTTQDSAQWTPYR